MGVSHFRKSSVEFNPDLNSKYAKFFGDTSGAYVLWEPTEDALLFAGAAVMKMGSFGTPLVMNQDKNYPLGVFGEVSVANALGTTVERGIWSRVKVSANQTGAFSIFGGQTQFRWADGAALLGSGVENAQYGGAWLYLEQDTTGQALADYAHASGVVVQVETFGNLTIPTNAHLSGVKIESRLGAADGSALTNVNGKIAGLFITKSPAASGVTAQNWPYGIYIEDVATDAIYIGSTSTRALMLAGTHESVIKVEGGTWRRGLMLKETLTARPSPANDDSLWGVQTTLTHQINAATAHFIGESIHLIKDVGDCWQVLPFEGALSVSQVVTRVGGLSLEFNITAQPDGAEGYWPYTSDGVYFGIYIYQHINNTIEGQAAICINDDWDAAIRVDPTELTNLINFNGASGCFAAAAFTNDTGALTGANADGYFTIDANGTQAKVPFWYDD